MRDKLYVRKKWILAFLFMAIVPFGVLAQTKSITGTVSDRGGNKLPGVSVLAKGTDVGTVTDVDGKYSINIPASSTALVFSFIGMEPQEVEVKNQSKIDVVLSESVVGLDEVVAIGYGTQRKSDLTSASVSVKSDNFVQGAVKDAGQLLQGKIAGLSISSSSGNPADGVEIMLRGINTLNGSSSPLVIVDGIPGDLNTVAPQDIEDISVLKDGSAAAIYGTRGGNGVIIIKTRKGQKNAGLTVDYSAYVSTQMYAKKNEVLTADDVFRLKAEGYNTLDTIGNNHTDWLDQISRTPFSHNHDLTVRGGTSTTSFVGTFNYQSKQGMILKSDYEKYTARLEMNHTAFNGLLNINIGLLSGNSLNDAVDKNFAYRQSLIYNPTAPVFDEDGSYYELEGIQDYDNPYSLLMAADGSTKDTYNRFYGEITLKPFEGMSAKLLVSRNTWYNKWELAESKQHISTVRDGANGNASLSSSYSLDNLLEFTLDYRKALGEHEINALAGYSYQDNHYETMYMFNKDFLTDYYKYNNIGVGAAILDGGAKMSSSAQMNKLIGFFGRVNYSFAHKYLLTVSVREDGSSKFGSGHRWGTFPAVQLGWNINKESFMAGVSAINLLKLRAGYGITGNEPKDPYMSLTLLKADDKNYVYYDGKWVQIISPKSNPNPKLGWESKKELNLGLDFALWGSRITGNINYYIRHIDDMLWNYSVPSPPNLYNSVWANVGKMENKGLEIGIQGTPVKTKDFTWIANVNYSTNSNKLVSLSNDQYQYDGNYLDYGYTGDPIQAVTHRIYFGSRVGDFYGYKSVDITVAGDEWGTTEEGEGVWVIENGEGERKLMNDATTDDKTIIGNGLPKFYIDFNNTFKYKGFDLAITMRGAFGFQILNYQRMFYENTNALPYNIMKSAYDKVYGKSVLTYSQEYVSYYVEDGDYWKIDNISLGYTFDTNKIKAIKSLRVYGSMLNALTFTNYKGLDPEVSRYGDTGLNPGSDYRDKFPTTRTFTLGLSLTF